MADEKNKVKNRESQLITALSADPKLEGDRKAEFISMARLFLENFKENMYKTSLEMDEIHPLGQDIWRDFLNYPIVRKYIQSFVSEKIGSIVDAGMMEGNKDAVNIKKAFDANGPAINNSNIILIRLPEKKDWS